MWYPRQAFWGMSKNVFQGYGIRAGGSILQSYSSLMWWESDNSTTLLLQKKKFIFWVYGRFPWYSTWTSKMNTCSLTKIINESRHMFLIRTSCCLFWKKWHVHSKDKCKWISDYRVLLFILVTLPWNGVVSYCNWWLLWPLLFNS